MPAALTDAQVVRFLRSMPPSMQALAQRFPPESWVRTLVKIGTHMPRHRRYEAGTALLVLSYGEPEGRFPEGSLWLYPKGGSGVLAQNATPARPDQVEPMGLFERCTDIPGPRDTIWVARALAEEES